MINKFWNACLNFNQWDEGKTYIGTVCFGKNADEAKMAIDKIINAEKNAHIYPANGYRNAMKGLAEPGQINIVVDWQDMPCIAIETTAVRMLRLDSLTDEICALEEKGMNLDTWKENYLPNIKKELEELGEELSDETQMVIEEFRLIQSV